MKPIKIILIQTILEMKYNISSDKIVGLYPFGSITYGTQTEKSDYDFVVIVDMETDYIQYESEDVDIHIMSINRYKTLLDKHDIMALEVYFNPKPILKFETTTKIDLIKLRHSISKVVSNSWVKAFKKVSLENEDDWVGYKSLFHSLRILDFGIQIAKYGKITLYTNMQPLWKSIVVMINEGKDIETIMKYFKPLLNENSTEFRKLAPKKR